SQRAAKKERGHSMKSAPQTRILVFPVLLGETPEVAVGLGAVGRRVSGGTNTEGFREGSTACATEFSVDAGIELTTGKARAARRAIPENRAGVAVRAGTVETASIATHGGNTVGAQGTQDENIAKV